MKAYIITTIIGCFGVDEKNNILDFRPFSKNPEDVSKKLKLSKTTLIKEEEEILKELKNKGFVEFVFQKEKQGFKSEASSPAEKYILENLRKIAIEKHVFSNQEEFNKFLISVNAELTRTKIKESIGQDKFLMQAVSALDELDKTLNIFMERLREMFGLNFPELDKAVANHEKYANLVYEYGRREDFEDTALIKIAERSMGMKIDDEDVDILRKFSKRIIDLYVLREELVKYIENTAKKIAPNTSDIAGSMLTAKLILKAGGLERLAKSTSSTIQLLGAEKSLFRFLHGKGRSPRFGILATHPLVQSAPEKLKGRIARAIASKLSIAAKIDQYSKEYKGDKMKKELQERINEIMANK